MALISALASMPVAAVASTVSGDGSFSEILSRFGVLRTAAGLGEEDDLNDWLDGMEGGSAREAELSRPHMTMGDSFGNLYIADKEAHAIRRVSPDGIITTVAGSTPGGVDTGGFNGDGPGTSVLLDNPNGLYTLPDGTTWIMDLGNDRIRRLGTDGMVRTMIFDEDGFKAGRGLWVSPDEQLVYYAAGDEVRRWTPSDGVRVFASGFSELGNLDVDAAGRVFVTDRNTEDVPGMHRVWRIDPAGTRTVVAGNGTTVGGGDGFPAVETGLNQVRGVACDDSGGFFLCTMKDPAGIWFVDPDGIIHLMITARGRGNVNEGDGVWVGVGRFEEKLSEPRSVALAPNGDLVITTNDQGFVRVVENIRPPEAPAWITLDHDRLTGAVVRWQSDRRCRYQVERGDPAAGLADPWETLGTVFGHPTLPFTTFEDEDIAGRAKGAYRVRVLKP